MTEVILKFELSLRTFFLSVKIFDKFLMITSKSFENSDILLLGIGCMFIASKYEDVENLNISVFVKHIGHNKITKEKLINIEQEILKTLNFDINLPVCVDFLTLISKVFLIPENILQAAENILLLFQLNYNTKYLPSLETVCALHLACSANNFNLSKDVLLLLSENESFGAAALSMKQNILDYAGSMQKYRSALDYRKFKIFCENSQFFINNLNHDGDF